MGGPRQLLSEERSDWGRTRRRGRAQLGERVLPLAIRGESRALADGLRLDD
jgi:hypothetical protein